MIVKLVTLLVVELVKLFVVYLHFCDMLCLLQYFGSPGHFKARRERYCSDGILCYFPCKLFIPSVGYEH